MRKCGESAIPEETTEAPEVATSVFSVSHRTFVLEMMGRYGVVWWILLGTAVAATAIAALLTQDLRWAIVSLMTVMILLPMAVAFLYFSYGLRRECWLNIVPHSVEFYPEALRVRVEVPPLPGRDEDEEDDAAPGRAYTISFHKSQVGRYRLVSEGLSVALCSGTRGFLRLPYSAFPSEKDLERAVEILQNLKNRQ